MIDKFKNVPKAQRNIATIAFLVSTMTFVLPARADKISAEDAYIRPAYNNRYDESVIYDHAIRITLTNIAINGVLIRYESEFDIVLSESGSIEQIIVYAKRGDAGSTITIFASGIDSTKPNDQVSYLAMSPNTPKMVAGRDSDNEILNSLCSFISSYGDALASNSGMNSLTKVTLSSCPFISRNESVEFSLEGQNLLQANNIYSEPTNISDQTASKPLSILIKDVQQALTDLGYGLGEVDGLWGARSAAAIESFYKDRGKVFDGSVSENEYEDLIASISQNVNSNPTINGELKPRILPITKTSTVVLPEYANDVTIIHGINVFDIDDDGRNEIFFCGTTYTNFVDHPVTVLSVAPSGAKDITSSVFGRDVPTSNDCAMIIFTDLNRDGLEDIVYSDSGMDAPPWTGTSIEVALNTGSSFDRITDQFEEKIWGIRSYAVAAGNLDRDPEGEIILTSGTDPNRSQVIQFSGSNLTIEPNKWVKSGTWDASASYMQVLDIDQDGKNDLFVGGNWASPSNQIYWGGLLASAVSILPDTKFGHYSGHRDGRPRDVTGADVVSSAISDFDNDGDLDIINAYEGIEGEWSAINNNYQISYLNSFIQILEQSSRRKFTRVAPDFVDDLGRRYYLQAFVVDLNHDGLDDVILNYWNKGRNWTKENVFSSTVLINRGSMNFGKFDAIDISGYSRSIDGMIFPVNIHSGGTEVLVLQPYSGSGTSRRFVSYRANLVFE